MAKRFLWTEERKLAYLRILANWKASHGASESYKWPELMSEFKKQTGETVDKAVLQNKLANMRTEYSQWQNFLKPETGVGVDPLAGFISMGSFRWVRNLKEPKCYRKFMSSSVPEVVEEMYSKLFDGSMATGVPRRSRSSCDVVTRSRRHRHSDGDDDFFLHSFFLSSSSNKDNDDDDFFSSAFSSDDDLF